MNLSDGHGLYADVTRIFLCARHNAVELKELAEEAAKLAEAVDWEEDCRLDRENFVHKPLPSRRMAPFEGR